jgi:hypothetical protein
MALADAGYTRTEIAAKLDLPYHRVAGVLKRGGRQMPNQTAIVQSARIRALNKARGEATRVKVRDLDDQGRRRAEIAAELGLSLQCVAQVLSDAGRGINAAERMARSRATRNAQSAALRAEILALDDLGRSRHPACDHSAAAVDQDLALEHNRLAQAIVLDVSGEAVELADRHQRDQGESRVNGMPVDGRRCRPGRIVVSVIRHHLTPLSTGPDIGEQALQRRPSPYCRPRTRHLCP